MDIQTIIEKKKFGGILSAEEIAFVVKGYVAGRLADPDVTPWLRAVFEKGLEAAETHALTQAMVESGETIDLSGIEGFKADKHSTGGVGDKTTLVVAPLAAACGVKIAKISGRALGHTGGTLDKLASIPGFTIELDKAAFVRQVNDIGVAIMAAGPEVAPADKKLYALRDRTKTVASLPLIASSIMSKKIACGAEYIVLDVKVGEGAFLKTQADAAELAAMCVDLGEKAGKRVSAFLTNMDRPLGRSVGTSLEVKEAIETLSGRGPKDVTDLCLSIVGAMLAEGGFVGNLTGGIARAKDILESGSALDKMREWIAAQGGDARVVDDFSKLRLPAFVSAAAAIDSGYIVRMDTEHIGWLARKVGGFVFNKKTGDQVKKGETLAYALAGDQKTADTTAQTLQLFFEIAKYEPPAAPLILETVNVPE